MQRSSGLRQPVKTGYCEGTDVGHYGRHTWREVIKNGSESTAVEGADVLNAAWLDCHDSV